MISEIRARQPREEEMKCGNQSADIRVIHLRSHSPALGLDAHGREVAAHRIDQVGKAALSRDGYAAQPGKAGGSSLGFRSKGHRLEKKSAKDY
jgi:hypothetical protein